MKHFRTDTPADVIHGKAAMRRLGLIPDYPGAPFAKRPEGRARRTERRQAIARKAAWLNS